MMISDQEMAQYLSGTVLYGDDFSGHQLDEWFADEEEAYAMLGAKDRAVYHFRWHTINKMHGFRHIGARVFNHALGIGSAYGDELLPVLNRLRRISILEPSDAFPQTEVNGVKVEYLKPHPTGAIPFDNSSIDLVTCFDVLHHIPNVTYVISEMGRCLSPGGFLVLREPVVSMGDWRYPRRGLTKRERGIPIDYLKRAIGDAGLAIVSEQLCMCRLVMKTWPKRLFGDVFRTSIGVRLDAIASSMLKCNLRYHASRSWHKLRPSEVYIVATKPDQD